MHKSNEDCFYFLTSSCAKGASCTYRHSPLALTCNVICPSWVRGSCLAPACPYRHTAIQRSMVNNGILCFYENTPTGCLKPECTFIHSRPRTHGRNTSTIRPVLTNPIKNDTTKTIVNNTPPTVIPPTTESNLVSLPLIKNETTSIAANGTSPSPNTSLPEAKKETITRRIAIPSSTEPSNEKKDLSENKDEKSSPAKCNSRSIITDSSKINSEEITTTRSRLVVNRNVVIGESTNTSSRTIVQTPASSNRVVVSSNSTNSSVKDKKIHVDSIGEETKAKKKFKADPQSTVDIPLPSSTSSTTNRLLLLSSKETTTTTTNDAKSIRLNRHRLPATKSSSGNSSQAVSTPSNEEEKTSAGTGLSQDVERRTMRLERFQTKPISPPQSTTRNVITSSSNERKRTAPETTVKDTPPSKRVSNASSQNRSSPRQTTSSPNVLTTSSSSVGNKNWEKQADALIAKNNQEKTPPPQPMPPSSDRPRFIPQLITPPAVSQSLSTAKPSRLRQPPSVVIKRPLVPVTASSSTSIKTIEKVSSTTSENNAPPAPSNTSNEEDENQLLILNESTDVVDTFAFIDEALLEADHLLELM